MEKKDENEMSATTGASGDRVTLAVLSHQITALTKLQEEQHKEVIEEIKAIKTTVHTLDTQQCVQAEHIAGIKKDIDDNVKKPLKEIKEDYKKDYVALDEKVDDLRIRDNWWNGANSALSVIAGIIGSLFKG